MSWATLRARWWLLATAGLVAAAIAAFHALFEKRVVEVDALPDGPAQHDPYYALGLYLQERGIEVTSTRRWHRPPPHDTAVFWFNWEAVPEDVREWVGEGGQLWAFTDPDGSVDWEPTPWPDGQQTRPLPQGFRPPGEGDAGAVEAGGTEPEPGSAEPAADAGVEAGADAGPLEPWECMGDDYACWQRATAQRAIRYCGDDQVACLFAAQFDYGEGCLTLVEREALSNPRFTAGTQGARVDALLRCPEAPRAVVFVRGLQAPWIGELLAQTAPEALLGALALLLLWMWRAARYLGPPAPVPAPARRQWMEHVRAVGRLSARVGLEPLVSRAREELLRRLELRVPEAIHLSGEPLRRSVSGALKLSEATVQRALHEPPRGTPAHTLTLARDMLELWRRL